MTNNELRPGSPISTNKVNFLEYLVMVAKHSRTIIFTSMAVTFLTYVILFILPNKYTATARLLPPQQNLTLSGQILDSLGGGNMVTGGGGIGPMGGMAASLLGLKTPGDLYVGILSGQTVFDQIISQFNLKDYYNVDCIEDARRALGKDTKISVGKKDGIITVEVTSDSPEKSAQMANAFVKELDHLMQGMTVREARERLTFLEKERLQSAQNLQKAEEALRAFSEKNSVLQIDTQTRGVLEYIARLRAEIDSKEVGAQVLRQQATPYNYDVVRMETEIKGLKEKLRNLECQYDSSITDVCLPTNKTPGLALEYIRLYREAKFQETLYQLYIKLVEIARMDMVRNVATIQVVDTAKPPQKKSNKRLLPSLIVGMLTFVVMVFMSIGREHWRNMNLEEDDAQRLAALRNYLKPWLNVKKLFSFKEKI